MAENKVNIPLDDFVSKVVKDPKQPPDTTLLTGYLGKSSEDGHTRLHFDPELKNYVEIPNDAILHTQEIPKEHSSLGGSHVWIKSDTELIHGKVGPSRTKAKFFEGPIGAAAAAAGGGLGGGAPNTAVLTGCDFPITVLTIRCATGPQGVCPSPFNCPSQAPFFCTAPPLTSFCTHGCPTPPAFCPPHTIHPINCIPHFTPNCPIASANCPSLGCPTIHQPACIPHFTPNCPFATAANCPSAGACPSIACGGFPGGGGDPAAHQMFAPMGGASQLCPLPTAPGVACPSHAVPCPTLPPGCQAPTPLCQSVHAPCLTLNPVCHPTPLCQSVHVPCLTPNPLVCHPTSPIVCHPQTPLCPTHPAVCHPTSPIVCHPLTPACPTHPVICQPLTPACPTVHACQTIPNCPSALGCPSGPVCGGGPVGGGGINQ